MYFRESANIASSQPSMADEIERLDDLLYENQGTTIRLVRIAAFLDFDDDQADELMQLFENAGIVSRQVVEICPDCDAIIETSGATVDCDLCGRRFKPKEAEQETGFTARHTAFESGDELLQSRRSGDHVDGVYRIIGCSNDDRVGDVVFVHGLDGDATQTWHPREKPDDYWPRWIGQDFPQVGVWSVDYEARSLKWKGNALPLSDRATNCIEKLIAAGIGERPLVFVTHSLGGLLVKQMLRHAKELAISDWASLFNNCRGIVFLGTPHSGSDLSGYVQYLKLILAPTVAVKDLEAHDPRLQELNTWYRNNASSLGIATKVYFETKKTFRIQIVNRTSADPGISGIVPIPIETNHQDICKPTSRGDVVYVGCKRFIQQTLINERNS